MTGHFLFLRTQSHVRSSTKESSVQMAWPCFRTPRNLCFHIGAFLVPTWPHFFFSTTTYDPNTLVSWLLQLKLQMIPQELAS